MRTDKNIPARLAHALGKTTALTLLTLSLAACVVEPYPPPPPVAVAPGYYPGPYSYYDYPPYYAGPSVGFYFGGGGYGHDRYHGGYHHWR